jgi:outer membrane protein assembly factor BamE (lipoprotein component of BamABCDE complex)
MFKTILINLSLCCLLSLSSCVSTLNNKGYLVDEDSLSSLKIGVSSKIDVLNIMGQPSIISDLVSNNFYYVTTIEVSKTSLSRKVDQQHVLALEFDKNDILQKIQHYDTKSDKLIAMSKDVTPAAGDDDRFTKKLFGNIGKFNKKNKKDATSNN